MKLEQFSEIIKNAQVFCEVGVYYYEEYCRLKNQINEGKTVILVEPARSCFANLLNHVGRKKNVKLVNCAIGDEYGVTTLHFEGASAFIEEVKGKAPFHVSDYYRENVPTEDVEKITFDQIDPKNIDVLLVDTEGMEYFVLKHMISRPKLIILETHYKERYINPYINEIKIWMKDNGYMEIVKDDADTAYLKL